MQEQKEEGYPKEWKRECPDNYPGTSPPLVHIEKLKSWNISYKILNI